MFIDTHAHLVASDFNDDRDEVIKRAQQAGVECVVVPATDLRSSREAVELAEKCESIYACVGVHPHEASSGTSEVLHEIEDLSNHKKVVAIGEIGLDFHYDFSPRERQVEVFKSQLEIAIRRNLPVVIHTRESIQEAIRAVRDAVSENSYWRMDQTPPYSRFPAPKGVFHCFSGDGATAWELLKMGFLVSFPGIVTFKNSTSAKAVQKVGIDHLMLETDSPYLAPVPLRGKRNEPANIPLIAEKIADLCDSSVEDVARATRYNGKKLFGIGQPDPPVIVYKMKNSLYLNITIRCDADCVFCDRKGEAVVKGHNLRITREPSSQEVIEAIGDPKRYDEIVFCGYGEPTIRLDVIKEVSRWVKEQGGRVRLDTDGHGSVIHHRNIVAELVGLVDSVSISLNSVDPKQYGDLMRIDGERYHKAMIEFARESVRLLPEVVMTIVGMDTVDERKAKDFVKKEIGAKLRVRPYF
jgi:TatD DNase family protein